MKTISLSELAAQLFSSQPPILVEALPERYYEQGHLPGALNININEVKTKAPLLLPQKHEALVIYCANDRCTNSDQLAVQLIALGYSNVSVFKEGKSAWQAAGYKLEQGVEA